LVKSLLKPKLLVSFLFYPLFPCFSLFYVLLFLLLTKGAEGKVDESLKAMAEVDELKNQKRIAEVTQ
jgi:hypothetical protein